MRTLLFADDNPNNLQTHSLQQGSSEGQRVRAPLRAVVLVVEKELELVVGG